ncbi:hypothetical protein Pmani_013346 [Petrolisthes manimaculis]|uniref:Uncharacterized protein n=1 Tax=Petrolisthes manimaculis TaxID=1843537 RepID=A0AAE1PW43_9EUCA|nr:hypothetical protein Pmani_013346 [Petrolisthes manimaculis]
MEEDVQRKGIDVSLETFFAKILHSCSYIRDLIDQLKEHGETLLAPRLPRPGQEGRQKKVRYCVINQKVIDCIIDQCLLAGLMTVPQSISLNHLMTEVHVRLRVGVSIGQVKRIMSHLSKLDSGISYLEENEAALWSKPSWLESVSNLIAYLKDLAG